MIPAIEYMAGLRESYAGPRRFWRTMPRGHDKTGTIARLANWAIAFSRNKVSGTAAASDRDQSRVLLQSMTREIELNPWLADRLAAHNYIVRGPAGEVEIVASDAGGASGLKADFIIMDEITYWRKRDLFDMLLSGAAKRPQSVIVIITNAGIRGSWQHQLMEACRDDPLWDVRETPPATKLASWMSAEEIASDRAKMTASHARRVYDNIWSDATDSPLLNWDAIRGCHDPSTLWPGGRPQVRTRVGNLYVGFDVGRTHDRSVISLLEEIGDVLHLRALKVLHKADFDRQESEFSALLNDPLIRPHLRKARIDRGGIGYQLAERMERKFPRIVEGIAMSQQWQGQAALRLAMRFEQRRIRIPDDAELNVDLQQVEEVGTTKGGVPLLRTDRNETGHGDRFWSIALAADAVPVIPQRPTAIPRGHKSRV